MWNPKQIIYFFIVSLGAACSSANSGGFNQDISKTSKQEIIALGMRKVGDNPSKKFPQKIFCVDAYRCWLQAGRTLWHSNDGGKSWNLTFELADEEFLRDYHFYSEQIGWATSPSKVYSTEDGGRTWLPRVTPLDEGNGEIHTLFWLNGTKTGWLVGGIFRPQTKYELKYGVPNTTKGVTQKEVLEQAIFRTDDGGEHWERQGLSPRLIGRILGLRFFDANRGIALDEGTIWITLDGGTHWRQSKFPVNCVNEKYLSDYYEAEPSSLGIIDSNTLLMSYSDGRIIKSTDGGRAWCDFVEPDQIGFEPIGYKYMQEMEFEDTLHGWGLGRDRFLYETKDGGKIWSRVAPDLRFDDMTFLSSHYGLLVSATGIYRMSF